LRDPGLYLAAARQALKAFPIDSDVVEPLALGENAVFRVLDTQGGASFVLRLHRPGYHTLEELDSERAWTGALNDAGISAPNGVRACDGGWYVSVPTPDPGGGRLAGVTAWTEGEILSDVVDRDEAAATPAHFARLGEFIARLHNQASRWSPPAGFSRHNLDKDGLVGEAPFWGRFWESRLLSPQERRIATAARGRIAERLLAMGKTSDCFGLIHADLHPGNVLIDAGRLSVIDFDDAAFGWHGFDLAVALFYAWARSDFPALRDAFLDGYAKRRRPIEGLEQDLPLFLLLRGLMLIGWRDQRPELDPKPYMGAWKARLMTECELLLAE
jgi:Ser/Thr protein kinase RdoA (MazF antagonist)